MAALLCVLASAPTPVTLAEGAPSYTWSSADVEGPAALRFQFTASEDAACAVEAGVANMGAPSGTQALLYASQNRVLLALGTGSGGAPVRAQAGAVLDSETLVRHDRSATGWRGGFEVDAGAFNVTLVARNASAWDNRITGLSTMTLTLDCDAPVTLAGHHGSREVLMLDAQAAPRLHLDAGAAGATLLAHPTRAFASETVEATVAWTGIQAGHLILDHPLGREERVFVADSGLLHRVGGAGAWGAQLDAHARTALSSYAGAIVGLAPLASPADL